MNSANNIFVAATLLLAAASSSWAFKAGAPAGACKAMTPHHHDFVAQSSKAPYKVTATKNGAVFDVSIEGKSADNTIKGFLVQAKQNGKVVGEFVVPDNDEHIQYVACDGKPKSAVTHKPYAGSLKSVTAKWSPKGVKDTVTFSATIVHSFPIFWVGVESESVKLE